MNPYDFVPIDFSVKPQLCSPVTHEKFQGISGNLIGKITAETPIFVKRENSENFTTNENGDYIIPSTSLKGLFRSIVETVAHGCFGGKFDGKYVDKQRGEIDLSSKLPYEFKECFDPESLCIACRIFGMLKGSKLFTGKVSFHDAVCERPVRHDTIFTVDLMGPKPHHTAFYLDGSKIAGRKFYFHHPQGLATKNEKTAYNQRLHPLNKDSQFTFVASFTNLNEDEWQALLYAIVLEPNMRHKIGYAKPSGLGSVKITIDHIRLINFADRYTSPTRGVTEHNKPGVDTYVADQIQSFTSNASSSTLKALRHIWRWDPSDPTRYRYPTAVESDWFKKYPQDPISKTP